MSNDSENKQNLTTRAAARRQELEKRIQTSWGKVSENLSQNEPTARLTALHEQQKALCFKDIQSSIRESVIEYAAKYRMLQEQYDRDADIHESIEARHMFIYADALYLLRAVEAEKGRRNLLTLESYFGKTPLKELGTADFALKARDFLEDRHLARERVQIYLGGMGRVDIRSSHETTEEWVSLTTRPVLSVFHHDFGNRSNKASLYHSIRNIAMNALADPKKAKLLETSIEASTEKFLARIPHLVSIQSFIQRMNSYNGEEFHQKSKPLGENVHSLFGRNFIEPR